MYCPSTNLEDQNDFTDIQADLYLTVSKTVYSNLSLSFDKLKIGSTMLGDLISTRIHIQQKYQKKVKQLFTNISVHS